MIANIITLTGFAFGVIGIFLPLNIGVIFFMISFLIDAIDGAIARKFNDVSEFGGVLDSTCDKIIEVLFIYYLSNNFGQVQLSIICAGFSILISYVKYRAKLDKSKKTVFDRPQRMIFLLLGAFINYKITLEVFLILTIFSVMQILIRSALKHH